MWRNDIFTAQGKNDGLRYEVIFFSRGQWKYLFMTQKAVEMPFAIFLWSIYPFIPGGFFFMQIPVFYLFFRKSSNKINEKSLEGINGYLYIRKLLYLMGMTIYLIMHFIFFFGCLFSVLCLLYAKIFFCPCIFLKTH